MSVSNIAKNKRLTDQNPLEYVEAWHDFMVAENLYEDAVRLGPDVEVFTRRLVGVEWFAGGAWEARVRLMLGHEGSPPEDKVLRLYGYAKNHPRCKTYSIKGWKLKAA